MLLLVFRLSSAGSGMVSDGLRIFSGIITGASCTVGIEGAPYIDACCCLIFCNAMFSWSFLDIVFDLEIAFIRFPASALPFSSAF